MQQNFKSNIGHIHSQSCMQLFLEALLLRFKSNQNFSLSNVIQSKIKALMKSCPPGHLPDWRALMVCGEEIEKFCKIVGMAVLEDPVMNFLKNLDSSGLRWPFCEANQKQNR